MTRRPLLAVAALVAALAIALPAVAQEGQPEMSPEQLEMMKKWQEYMTPGDAHARMARMEGRWAYTSRVWFAPGTPPEESTGTSKFGMMLGGRYLIEHVEGSVMGKPFKGMALGGYDNMTKKYQSIWIDNMGSGIMVSEGTCDETTCTYYGEAPDLVLGKYKTVKSVMRHIDDDTMVFAMYDKGPDGKEWKTLEMEYKRQK